MVGSKILKYLLVLKIEFKLINYKFKFWQEKKSKGIQIILKYWFCKVLALGMLSWCWGMHLGCWVGFKVLMLIAVIALPELTLF